MLENPFEGPKARDTRGTPPSMAGAWEGELSSGAIAGEAWRLVRGTKGPMALALLGVVLAISLTSFVSGAVGLDGQSQLLAGDLVGGLSRSLLGSLLFVPITALPTAVLAQMALTRARGGMPGFDDVRRVLDKAIPIIVSTLLTTLVTLTTLVVGVVIGGIVLSILCSPVQFLVLGYGLSPVEALKASIKGTWSNFGVALLLTLIAGATALPFLLTLGVFLFWALPYVYLSVAVFTLRVFGAPTEPA